MRITLNRLQDKCETLNSISGLPRIHENGKMEYYSIDCSYGGYDVQRRLPTGGVQSMLGGHESAKVCYSYLRGTIDCLLNLQEKLKKLENK